MSFLIKQLSYKNFLLMEIKNEKNILIIGGSLRAKSFNKYLASNLIEIGKENFNFEIFSDFLSPATL